MPPRPRRDLLGSIGTVAIALLAGCNSSAEETTETPTATPTASPTETETATETETTTETETPTELVEGPGPLPEQVWPLSHRGPTNGAYLPEGPVFESEPAVDWQVEPSVPPDQEVYAPDFTEPAIADGQLFTVKRLRVTPEVERPDAHFLRAYDTTTGEENWEYTIEHGTGPDMPTSAAVGDGVVFVGQEARLHAVDTAAGTDMWTRTLPNTVDAIYPTPDRVYVKANRSLVALTSDNERLWTREFDALPDTLATGTDNVYVTSSRQLLALDPATGDRRWQEALPAVTEGQAVKNLVAVEGGVFTLQYSGDLQAFDTSGTKAWESGDSHQAISSDGSRLYAAGEGRLRALAVRDGSTVWEVDCEDIEDCAAGSTFRKPVVTDTALYTSLTSGRLLAVRPTDGTIRWGWEAPMDLLHLSLGPDAIYASGGELDPVIRLQPPETT